MSIAFFGKNSRTKAGLLFYSKKLYYDSLKNVPNLLDLWYTKPLYGKVDTNFRTVFPSAENMKVLLGSDGRQDSFALNFVADAFEAMRIYIEGMSQRKKINPSSFFNPLNVHSGWQDTNSLYKSHVERMYNSFVEGYLLPNKGGIAKQIASFETFIPFFRDYLNARSTESPLTKSGYISKTLCPYSASGLVIEIAQEADYSNDPVKWRSYFNDLEFTTFLDIANQFGFYIDMNVPWRLIANLDSPAWQTNTVLKEEIVDKYFEEGYNVQSVFDKYYFKSHLYDIDMIKVLTMQFYNSFVSEYPSISQPVHCDKASFSSAGRGKQLRRKTKYRRSINMTGMEHAYDNLFWLRFYFQLRIKESDIAISTHQAKHELTEIDQQYATMGFDFTLEHIATRLSFYLQEQMKEMLSQETQKKILTSGQVPDIMI